MKSLIYVFLAGLIFLLAACGTKTNDTDGTAGTNTTPVSVQTVGTNTTPVSVQTVGTNTTPVSVQTIELILPFTIHHEPEGIMPLGETINHAPPMGHPGIDFQWSYKEAEIIVALDGVVGDIITEVSPIDGDTIYRITVITGEFGVYYEVVDLPKFNPNLQIGDELVSGMILGYPLPIGAGDGWRMIHWAFGLAFENKEGRPTPEGIIEKYFFEWLCPMEYFTESERLRLERLWADASYDHKDEFPKICNGYYELPEQ
ncbi:MAG TPA: hypothetical protein QGE92_01410 [Dehalococcoidales bacterium]|nr:hypothetical protein [Dehalococcoidales bacterium]MDP7109967.1 hypothetical protein [Dehalococcoidales bacterium]HJM36566.1 hypothetical protein [Dehalococcoidales bacterium]